MTNLLKKQTNLNSLTVQFSLAVYHAFFIFFAYKLRIQQGHSDAHGYWGLQAAFDKPWLDYLKPGTHFIYFLNYHPVHWDLPFWSGFLIYGTVGFFGLMLFYNWAQKVLPERWSLKPYAMLALMLWPGLHYWTAGVGKEPLVFLALAILFNRISGTLKNKTMTVVAVVLLVMIRPHVALFLLLAGAPLYIIFSKTTLKSKLLTSFGFVILGSGLLYNILQLTKIKRLDWNRIQRYNNHSLKSFSDSGSYVPMDTYNIPERLFAFFFRPLPLEAQSFLQSAAALENSFYLLLHMLFIWVLIKNFKYRFPSKIPPWIYFAGFFMLVCGAFYIFRYANFGIFMRTKIMYAPFWITAILWMMSSYEAGVKKSEFSPSTGSG